MDRSSCHSYFQHFFAWAFSLMKANFYPRVYGGRKWLVLLIPSRRERWEPTAIIPQSIKKVPLFCARRLPKCVSQPPGTRTPSDYALIFFVVIYINVVVLSDIIFHVEMICPPLEKHRLQFPLNLNYYSSSFFTHTSVAYNIPRAFFLLFSRMLKITFIILERAKSFLETYK